MTTTTITSSSSAAAAEAFATRCIHSDQARTPDIAAPIHLSTTYRYGSDYNELAAVERGLISAPSPPPPNDVDATTAAMCGGLESVHIYSRDTMETRDRLEAVLGAIEGVPDGDTDGAHAITFSSGLAAVTAALNYYQPKRVVISKEGYHGTHGSLELYRRGRNVDVLHLEDEPLEFKAGDLIWLESPRNPCGETYDIAGYKARCPPGAMVAVDSTFAPPPLQHCLKHGADVVMHSSTKFLGGHSDLLGGVLTVRDPRVAKEIRADRVYSGSVMGNLEAWLLLRSLRTLEVRVRKQSATATALAAWLSSDPKTDPCLAVISRVWHGSIPTTPGHQTLLKSNFGFSGVFAIEFTTHAHARRVVTRLRYFQNATSLGGVESLIEWRAAVDPKIDPRICRVSVGLEDFEDLKRDLAAAFHSLLAESA